MTILAATEALISWFAVNDSFSLSFSQKEKDDFPLLFKDLPDNHKNKSAVLLALEALKENGILKSNEASAQKHFVLNRPLSSLSQTVTLDFFTCSSIAKILNDISETTGYSSDPQNITCTDIQNLTGFTLALVGTTSKPERTEEIQGNDQFSNN